MSGAFRTLIVMLCFCTALLALLCTNIISENRRLETEVLTYKSSYEVLKNQNEQLEKALTAKEKIVSEMTQQREEMNQKIKEALKDEKVREACRITIPNVFNGMF